MVDTFHPFLGKNSQINMKKELLVTITGIIVLVSGVIFHLQGQSIVGPQSSFMYANPEWITYGMQIAIVGAIIILIGGIILLRFRK